MNEIEEGTIELEKKVNNYLKDLDEIHRRITNEITECKTNEV